MPLLLARPPTHTGVTTLSLDRPLAYTHLGERFTGPNGLVMDMRAEVAVLSRNVVVQVGCGMWRELNLLGGVRRARYRWRGGGRGPGLKGAGRAEGTNWLCHCHACINMEW